MKARVPHQTRLRCPNVVVGRLATLPTTRGSLTAAPPPAARPRSSPAPGGPGRCGQAHPTKLANRSGNPITTPHGVKMSVMNVIAVAIPASSGQIVGGGWRWRLSGSASSTVVTSTSRTSVRSPASAGSPAGLCHSGARPSTIGTSAKLYGRGGEAAAHSRVSAPQGFASGRPRRTEGSGPRSPGRAARSPPASPRRGSRAD